jgi:hypothetical protein
MGVDQLHCMLQFQLSKLAGKLVLILKSHRYAIFIQSTTISNNQSLCGSFSQQTVLLSCNEVRF